MPVAHAVQIRRKVPVKIEKQRDDARLQARLIPMRLLKRDLAHAADIADQRITNARAKNRTDGQYATNLTPFEVEVMGCAGELAVCKYLGIEWKPCVDRPDDGIDFTLRNGISGDVKATGKVGNRLLFPYLEKFKADIAVLAYAHPAKPDVFLAGWIRKEEFLAGYHRAFQCKDKPGMLPLQLHPMEELLALAKEK